jgi:FixJ family two-component response regulator
MPGTSGIELQKTLIAKGINVPIIFITAFPDERIRAQAMQAGAFCFLSKPFESAEMIRCVNDALKAKSDED